MPTFDTPEPISVTLELGIGDIRIVAAERADTTVDVRPSDPAKKSDVSAAEQTRVDYAGGRLSVKAPKGWRQYSRGGQAIRVEIGLPAGSHVRGLAGVAAFRAAGRLGDCHYKTGVGDIHVEQAGERLELKTGAGDIEVGQTAGQVEVATGTGTVRIGTIGGAAVVKNSNGDTWIGEAGGDLRVNGADGRIVVERAEATVAAKTANGDVELREVANGAIVAETARGKVDIAIRAGVTAWLDLDTGYGTVQNHLPATEQPRATDKAVTVCARTAFGNITVGRAATSQTSSQSSSPATSPGTS